MTGLQVNLIANGIEGAGIQNGLSKARFGQCARKSGEKKQVFHNVV